METINVARKLDKNQKCDLIDRTFKSFLVM